MSSQSGFPLDKAVLGFLMQGPAHGYALHERAEEELGRIWYMGMSNVYATLKDLERAGSVDATLDDESYPPRKVYAITSQGKSAFLSWVREPVLAMRDMRVEFLAKLYFFLGLGLDGLGALLEAQASVCRGRLDELHEEAEASRDSFEQLVTEFRRRRIEASLAWLSVVREGWG